VTYSRTELWAISVVRRKNCHAAARLSDPAGVCLAPAKREGISRTYLGKQGAMGEERITNSSRFSADEVIAAFDRERSEAHELQRRHSEQVRSSRGGDRPARSDASHTVKNSAG